MIYRLSLVLLFTLTSILYTKEETRSYNYTITNKTDAFVTAKIYGPKVWFHTCDDITFDILRPGETRTIKMPWLSDGRVCCAQKITVWGPIGQPGEKQQEKSFNVAPCKSLTFEIDSVLVDGQRRFYATQISTC